IDRSAPTVAFGAASPAANGTGWNSSDVSVPFTVSESLSGLASASAASPLVLSTEGSAVLGSVTVTDLAGNTATYASPSYKIDKTPPTLTFGAPSPAANAAGWNNSDVSIAFSASDAGSGVASTSAATPLLFTTDGAGQT